MSPQDEEERELLEDLLVRAMRARKGGKGPGGNARGGGKGKAGGKGKGGGMVKPRPSGSSGGKRPKVDHFMQALKYLWIVMQHMGPADPAHLKEGLPKVVGMLEATHGVLKAAVKAAKENKDATPKEAIKGIDSLGAELKKAGKMEGLSIMDVTKFLMQVTYNGLKGEKSCGTLFEGLMKLFKAKPAPTGEPAAQAETEKEIGDRLSLAAVADLECVEKTVSGVVSDVKALQGGPTVTGAELETKLGHIALAMGKMNRDITGAAKGLYILRGVLEHLSKLPKPTEPAPAARSLSEEMETLLKMLS